MLFDLCYHGHLDFLTVYQMPVQYRKFYYSKLVNVLEKKKDDYDKIKNQQNQQTVQNGPPKMGKPLSTGPK